MERVAVYSNQLSLPRYSDNGTLKKFFLLSGYMDFQDYIKHSVFQCLNSALFLHLRLVAQTEHDYLVPGTGYQVPSTKHLVTWEQVECVYQFQTKQMKPHKAKAGFRYSLPSLGVDKVQLLTGDACIGTREAFCLYTFAHHWRMHCLRGEPRTACEHDGSRGSHGGWHWSRD